MLMDLMPMDQGLQPRYKHAGLLLGTPPDNRPPIPGP